MNKKLIQASVVAPVVSDIKTGATTAKTVQIANDAIREGAIRNWDEYPELEF